ncbi:NAD(P)/FAD-dependent oxidoreductase [Hoyosella rhizosphaerae]|uniref:Monooxygenase n=1 Tax=Hoyosella rhizosphaerae TaxID=1755582 RepID=A0A916UAH2_9ACTN|nr:NAD(P)/FAD-dependent oxidoreductase [Hoyosella rhizosphaerae]MBN4926075.1 NAD(P)/FAD-dependent oxidoreductase [Hoyosella rhizosphaerae]GGC65764.1 monooxygenase [Hoyosella rhizosphaerae]
MPLSSAAHRTHQVQTLIIGTGFSGMGMAIQMLRSKRTNFLIIDKADEFGGTWRDNTYPGCACDVPSHMYSFSFEPNARWTKLWAEQPEIFDYMKRVAEKHNLREHTHFGRTFTGAKWDDDRSVWTVQTAEGHTYEARFLISGVGALHIPSIPQFPGDSDFTGTKFHSAQWNHDVSLRGKRVAVIGTGASAIQFVPEIVGEVAELHLYQRTPAWVLPRKNLPITAPARTALAHVPFARRAVRNAIYWASESLAFGLNGNSNVMKPLEKLATWNIERSISDPELRRKLTPSYRIGCKRILGSNSYYPALAQPQTEVITDGIREFTPTSIISNDGVEREVDVVIYATGFHVTDGFDQIGITGRDGIKLKELWNAKGMETHLGITVAGFPNAFFLLGPNTGLGHNSVVFMIEQQIGYVLSAMKLLDKRGGSAIDVKQSAQSAFNEDVQRKLSTGVWSTGGCTSWYLDSQGMNRTIWPGFTWQYWARTRSVDANDFELIN